MTSVSIYLWIFWIVPCLNLLCCWLQIYWCVLDTHISGLKLYLQYYISPSEVAQRFLVRLFVPTVFDIENIFTRIMTECACFQTNRERRIIIFFLRDVFAVIMAPLILLSLASTSPLFLSLYAFSTRRTLLISMEMMARNWVGSSMN